MSEGGRGSRLLRNAVRSSHRTVVDGDDDGGDNDNGGDDGGNNEERFPCLNSQT